MPDHAPEVDKREVTDRYDYVLFPPDDPFPRFKVRHPPRRPDETDAQYAVARRCTERHHRILGLYLGQAQAAATDCGYFRHCAKAACRRAHKCVARRDENDWSIFPGPMMPPCCDRIEVTEPLRQIIRDVMADCIKGIVTGKYPELEAITRRVNLVMRVEKPG